MWEKVPCYFAAANENIPTRTFPDYMMSLQGMLQDLTGTKEYVLFATCANKAEVSLIMPDLTILVQTTVIREVSQQIFQSQNHTGGGKVTESS